MICPVCKESMLVYELNDIEIDSCSSCGGIWLDAGELELMLQDSLERDALLQSFKKNNDSKEKRRKCPICLKKMLKVECGIDEKIILDQCQRGDGIWFDANELNAILKMTSLESESKVLRLLEEMFRDTKGEKE